VADYLLGTYDHLNLWDMLSAINHCADILQSAPKYNEMSGFINFEYNIPLTHQPDPFKCHW
jgi:hypothetical protein